MRAEYVPCHSATNAGIPLAYSPQAPASAASLASTRIFLLLQPQALSLVPSIPWNALVGVRAYNIVLFHLSLIL